MKSLKCIDLNKTRKNILFYSTCDLPVFSVMDDVKLFNGELSTGFYLVESDNYFPLRGNGWYSLPMVKYCIDNNIISKDDIIYQLKASFNVPKFTFQSFIEAVYEKFGKLAKQAINSWIGCFGKQNREVSQVKFTSSFEEARYYFMGDDNCFVSQVEEIYELFFKKSREP